MSDVYEKILDLRRQDQRFCIVTVVETTGSTPRSAGARGLIFPNRQIWGTVGGGAIEQEAIETAQSVLTSGAPLLKKFVLESLASEMHCGGTMTLYFEPVLPRQHLTLFGGGHVGQAIAHAAHLAGWQITVVDQRQEVLKTDYFPPAARLIRSDYLEYIHRQSFTQFDWLVIATPKHAYDESILDMLISQEPKYIGMLASEAKSNFIRQNLIRKGVDKARLDRIYSPIGLNVGTETPGEIAIAIVGEMLALKNAISEVRSCSR